MDFVLQTGVYPTGASILQRVLVHKVSRETVKIRRGNGKFHVF